MGFWDKLMRIDRRIIFLCVVTAVTLPLFLDISQEIIVSAEVQDGFDAMDLLQPGSRVLIPCDYDPPSAPELQPMAVTAIRFCLEREMKFIIMGLWPQGPQQANAAFETALGRPVSDTITYNGKNTDLRAGLG